MWVIAGVLLGLVVLASLIGFHVGPHAHVAAGVLGVLAAAWLVVMALDGRSAPVLWALLSADVVVSAGIATLAWKGLTTTGTYAGRHMISPEGAEGVAVGDLDPEGIVRVNGENWSAVALNAAGEGEDTSPGSESQRSPSRGLGRPADGTRRSCRARSYDPDRRCPGRGFAVLAWRGDKSRRWLMIVGIVIGVVVLCLLILAGISVRIVREYQRIVLFRLGRALGTRGPGLIFINPATDRTSWVDLREQYLEIPHQTAITKDNASISIDFIIFYKVVDPSMSVLRVGNFAGAAQNVAATTLRSVVGDMPLDDVLSKREEMNASLRVRLDEVTERWGVKVTTVEVREVNPPPGVLDAMTRQMSAERTRRAAVTEAEGQKQAAITLAEGTKQAAILAAEGERQSAILRAEGLSAGLERILTVARGLDSNTMQLQYLETLKQVGSSPSTKLVVPMELGGLLNGLKNILPVDPGRFSGTSSLGSAPARSDEPSRSGAEPSETPS